MCCREVTDGKWLFVGSKGKASSVRQSVTVVCFAELNSAVSDYYQL